jgi:hypothetical protein
MKFVTILAGMMLLSQTEQAIIFSSANPSNLRGQPVKLGTLVKNTAGMASNVISKANTAASQIPSQVLTATNILSTSGSNSSSDANKVQINLNNLDRGFASQTSSGSSGSSNKSAGMSLSGSSSSSMSTLSSS